MVNEKFRDILNFTFCPIDVQITTSDLNQMKQEVLSIPSDIYKYDPFRNTYSVILFNNTNNLDKLGRGWTNLGMSCPTIVTCYNKLFDGPLTHIRDLTNLYLVVTKKNTSLNLHADSIPKPNMFYNSLQVLIDGYSEKFYFMNEQYEKIYNPCNMITYVINHSHVHACDMPCESDRIILSMDISDINNWSNDEIIRYVELLKIEESIRISRPDDPNYIEKYVPPNRKR